MSITPSNVAISLAMSLALAGCGGGESSHEESIEVASNRTTCQTLTENLCYEVRATGTSDWNLLYENIDGLNYEWGRQYSLRVRVTQHEGSGQADAPSTVTRYQVLSVVSSTQVPAATSFSFVSRSPYSSIARDGSGHWTFEGVPLVCAEAVCQALASAQSYPGTVQLDFDHANSPTGPLNLVAVSPLPL